MEYPYRKCAAAVLFNDSGRVLVCARNDLQHDDWQFPQGGGRGPAKQLLMPRVASFMKKRRSGRFSLLRPWKKACVILFPTSFWRKEKRGIYNPGQDLYWSLFRFVGEESEINLDTAEPEFRKYEWVTLDEAVKRAVDFKKDAYKKMAAAFKPFIG